MVSSLFGVYYRVRSQHKNATIERLNGEFLAAVSDYWAILTLYESEELGRRSGESTRLPPIWPGFDSLTRRRIWVEFVGSLLCSERFSPLAKNQHLI